MRHAHLVYEARKNVKQLLYLDSREYGALTLVELGDEDLRGRCGHCGHGLYISGNTPRKENIYTCRYGCGTLVQCEPPNGFRPVNLRSAPEPQRLVADPDPDPSDSIPVHRVLILSPDGEVVLNKALRFWAPKHSLMHIETFLDGWIEPKKKGVV